MVVTLKAAQTRYGKSARTRFKGHAREITKGCGSAQIANRPKTHVSYVSVMINHKLIGNSTRVAFLEMDKLNDSLMYRIMALLSERKVQMWIDRKID